MLFISSIVWITLSSIVVGCSSYSVLSYSIFKSILSLVVSVLCISIIYIMSGAEYMGFNILIVYIGAIAVLLLFMVNTFVQHDEIYNTKRRYFIPIILAIVTFSFQIYVLQKNMPKFSFENGSTKALMEEKLKKEVHSVSDIFSVYKVGRAIYGRYSYEVILTGLILLASLIGVVILSNKSEVQNKNNIPPDDEYKTRKSNARLVKVKSYQGVKKHEDL